MMVDQVLKGMFLSVVVYVRLLLDEVASRGGCRPLLVGESGKEAKTDPRQRERDETGTANEKRAVSQGRQK